MARCRLGSRRSSHSARASRTAELDRLVARHPLRERLWALLMLALFRCRRQSEALAVYQQARGVLLDGLGIEPGPGAARAAASDPRAKPVARARCGSRKLGQHLALVA
jgi:DNA-binding SARP family transcriptional activator